VCGWLRGITLPAIVMSLLWISSFAAEAAAQTEGLEAGRPVSGLHTGAHGVLLLTDAKGQAVQEEGEEDALGPDPWADETESFDTIPDPLEPMNRAFFEFNDKMYFYVLKPLGTGYKMVVPEVGRICIRNFFTNLIMPIRAISCLLQGKFEGFGIELVRCMVNTTAGFLGFQDVAREALRFQIQDEDLGQVFAFYGMGPGCYLNLPFLGPSSLRDTAGWVGGLYLNPLDYMVDDFWPNVGFRTFDTLNKVSMRIGEYESIKKAALDPYVAMRDAYGQYRLNQTEK